MNREKKLRYLLAIYLIVALSAILFGVFAFGQNNATWQSLFLNIATELFGVVFIFFLVNKFFLIGDWDLSDQVMELIQKLKNPSAGDFFKKPLSPLELQTYIQDAKKIDMCGVTLTATINRNFSDLRQRLLDGADVRVIICSVDALQGAAKRSEAGSVAFYQKRLESSLDDIQYFYKILQDYKKTNNTKAGNLSVGFLDYTPSFGLIGYQSVNNSRTLIIEIYPHHTGYDLPPIFVLTPENDRTWFDYFQTQFEEMWKKTTLWRPDMKITKGRENLTRNKPSK